MTKMFVSITFFQKFLVTVGAKRLLIMLLNVMVVCNWYCM